MLGILRTRRDTARAAAEPRSGKAVGPGLKPKKAKKMAVSPALIKTPPPGRGEEEEETGSDYGVEGAAVRESSVTASDTSSSPTSSPSASPPRPLVVGLSVSAISAEEASLRLGSGSEVDDEEEGEKGDRKAEPIKATEGEGEAAAAVPVPCGCVPLTLLGKPAYQHARAEEEVIRGYMKAFGERSMTYVHFHRSHKHYELPGVGLVSYCWVLSFAGRAAFVAIDPLCKHEDTATLLHAFERDVPGMKHYVAVSDRVAEVLREMGYDTTLFGRDYYADMDKYKIPKGRRRYLNEGRNHGLVVKELTWTEVEAQGLAPRVQEISDNWLKTRQGGNRELQLMTWPFYHGDEWESRKFYLFEREDLGGQMLAYMFFTPCFRDGRIIGYQANILRRDPKIAKPTYALDFLLLHCYDTFKKEGLEFLSLSIAPLYGIGSDGRDSRMLRGAFSLWYNFPEALTLYAFKGLGKHKDHFKVNRVEPLWACTKGTRSALAVQQLIMTVTNTLPFSKLLHGVHS